MFDDISPAPPRQEYLAIRTRLGMRIRQRKPIRAPEGVTYTVKTFKGRQRVFMEIKSSLMSVGVDDEVRVPTERWKSIIKECAEKHNLSVSEIAGKDRTSRVVKARDETCYRMSTETTLSLTQIATRSGYKEHSGVASAIKRHKQRMAESEQ